jgi:hypothetical protein
MLWQIWIGFALRHDTFKVVLTGEPEQSVAIPVNVIAVKKTPGSLGHDGMKSQLAVDQWQIPKVFAVVESAVYLIIAGLGVIVPQNIEGDEARLSTPEQQITEQRLASRIEANDLAIQHAAVAFQVASKSLAYIGKTLERITVS